jgi:hypothetical protein
VHGGIEDLHFGVRLYIAGGDFAFALGVDINDLGAVAVQLGRQALDIEDDLSHILLDTGDG